MKTVGQILNQARTKKGLTIEQAAAATKIQPKFLLAMESDEFYKLPSLAYAKGFVRNYSSYLGISQGDLMAFFRRQTKDVPRSSLLPKADNASFATSWLQLTPGKFLALLLAGLTIIFLFYLTGQYLALRRPPNLTVEAPPDNLATASKRIEIIGKTDPDVTITINNASVLLRSDGGFFDQVVLEAGVNKITIIATNRFGKSTTIVREVRHQP